MDARSRRIVGYALGRRIDAKLTLAALTTAIEHRNPLPGRIHHSEARSTPPRGEVFNFRAAYSFGRRSLPGC